MQELVKRVLVSVVFIPFLVIALWLEGLPLFFMFLLVSAFGAQEYIAMMRKAGIIIPWLWMLFNPILYTLWVFFPKADLSLIMLALLATVIHALLSWDEIKSVPKMQASLYGAIYTALMPGMIVRIGWQLSDKKILLALILMIWIVDSTAYFVGMRFGKKRDITPVSPRKSREGFIGGLLAPVVISIIMYISGYSYFSVLELGLIVIAAGVFGQLGDLLESMLKRFCNVKDSSKLIPGHGGILDRTDSILLAGSFLYAALAIL